MSNKGKNIKQALFVTGFKAVPKSKKIKEELKEKPAQFQSKQTAQMVKIELKNFGSQISTIKFQQNNMFETEAC